MPGNQYHASRQCLVVARSVLDGRPETTTRPYRAVLSIAHCNDGASEANAFIAADIDLEIAAVSCRKFCGRHG